MAHARMTLSLLALLALPAAGCGGQERGRGDAPARTARPTTVLADTAEALGMPLVRWPEADAAAAPPAALAHIAPSRAGLEPAPEAPPRPPTALPSEERGAGLAVDEGLQPPIPRGPFPFHISGRDRGWIELDLRVDEEGRVSDAEWAASSNADSAQVSAAIEAALAMRFHPALRRGQPEPVWARQRFEVGRPPR